MQRHDGPAGDLGGERGGGRGGERGGERAAGSAGHHGADTPPARRERRGGSEPVRRPAGTEGERARADAVSRPAAPALGGARTEPVDDPTAGNPVGRDKARLRGRLLAVRRAAHPGPHAARLADRVLGLPEIAEARCVAAYVGMSGEPDTGDLLSRLRARGVRVLLPTLRADLDLDFREYTGTLVPGAMGTREPPSAAPAASLADADAVIIPALAVDRGGRRLGRGAGSYDRALARVPANVPVIAVLHDREVLERVPAEPHDRAVKIIVTPSRTLRCEPADSAGEHHRSSRR